jgi:hypothetical protein
MDKDQWMFQDEIEETHPANDFDDLAFESHVFEADKLAMHLVGERYEKRDLVDMARWLILKAGIIENHGRSNQVSGDAVSREDYEAIRKLAVYHFNRREAAEKYIEKCPCDPDITPEQIKAHREWMDLVKGKQPPQSAGVASEGELRSDESGIAKRFLIINRPGQRPEIKKPLKNTVSGMYELCVRAKSHYNDTRLLVAEVRWDGELHTESINDFMLTCDSAPASSEGAEQENTKGKE